jgi:hypothetical protein
MLAPRKTVIFIVLIPFSSVFDLELPTFPVAVFHTFPKRRRLSKKAAGLPGFQVGL